MSEVKMDPKWQLYTTGDGLPPLAKGKLRLYSMPLCPFAKRARLMLAFKQVPYETININLKAKPEWLLERNPNGTVPVLEKDDVVVYESLIVADYVNTVYPDPAGSTPADPYRKARDAMLIDFFSKKYLPNSTKIKSSKGQDKEAAELLKVPLQRMEDELSARKSTFFGGVNPGCMDFMVWPWMERFPELADHNPEVTLKSFPKLARWREVMLTQPAVKECMQ